MNLFLALQVILLKMLIQIPDMTVHAETFEVTEHESEFMWFKQKFVDDTYKHKFYLKAVKFSLPLFMLPAQTFFLSLCSFFQLLKHRWIIHCRQWKIKYFFSELILLFVESANVGRLVWIIKLIVGLDVVHLLFD